MFSVTYLTQEVTHQHEETTVGLKENTYHSIGLNKTSRRTYVAIMYACICMSNNNSNNNSSNNSNNNNNNNNNNASFKTFGDYMMSISVKPRPTCTE